VALAAIVALGAIVALVAVDVATNLKSQMMAFSKKSFSSTVALRS
jgi:hypothetical protein